MFKAAHEMLSERVRTSESERERLAAELGATQHKPANLRCARTASQASHSAAAFVGLNHWHLAEVFG